MAKKKKKDLWDVKSDYQPTEEELRELDYLAKFLVDEFYDQIKKEKEEHYKTEYPSE